jgi:hypothetical protein
MSAPLNRLLEHVLDGEPAGSSAGDEVDAVFRDADRLRRRRTQSLLAAGLGGIAVIGAAGYLLATTLIPVGVETTIDDSPAAAPPSAVTAPSTVADPVLSLVSPVVDAGMHVYPRPPERGEGWRQYSIVGKNGKPRGTLELAVYAVKDDLCFPVLAAPDECAHTSWAPMGVEYVRYDDEKDADWQVHETMARRISDGRTVVVMATGERDAADAAGGKPGLSGAQVEKVATDKRMFDAFGPEEKCSGAAASACPVFKVAVPADQVG